MTKHAVLAATLLCSCAAPAVVLHETFHAVDRSRTIAIEVVDPNGAPVAAAFVALQDGDGPWSTLEPAARAYRATLKHERYGLAIVCADVLVPVPRIELGTARDEARYRTVCPGRLDEEAPVFGWIDE